MTLFLSLTAQKVERDYRIMELVKAAGNKYLYVSASNDTLEVAVKNVINLLSEKIKNTVVDMTESDMEIIWFDGKVENAKSTITLLTTSNVKLEGLRILTVKVPNKKDSQHTVFAYIEQSKIEETYDEIKASVLEMHEAYAISLDEEVDFYCSVWQTYKHPIDSLFVWDDLR